MAHPLLQHVERNTVHARIDPKAMAQALRTAVRRIRYPGLYHDALHDLPDPRPSKRPNRCAGLPFRLLRLSDAVGRVQRV